MVLLVRMNQSVLFNANIKYYEYVMNWVGRTRALWCDEGDGGTL